MGALNAKLNPQTLQELTESTGLGSEEVVAWYKDFMRGCPSGKLKKREFEEIYKQFFPNGDAGAFSREVFRTFDKDHNGTIDFAEFLTGMSVVNRGSVEAKLKWAFAMYDVDSSGTITKEEMLHIIKAIFKMRGETTSAKGESATDRMEALFARLDTNRDNVITEEEFINAAQSDPAILEMLKGAK